MLAEVIDALQTGQIDAAVKIVTDRGEEFLAETESIFRQRGEDVRHTKERILSLGDHLPDDISAAVIRMAIADDDEIIRVRGLQAAYRRRVNLLKEDITRILRDQHENFEARKWAIHILATTEGECCGDLIRALARDRTETPEMRREAIFALTSIAGEGSIGTLCVLLGDALPEIRQAAAWALGRISSPRSTDCLLAAIEDEDSEVRDWAIRALRDMDDTRALQGLADALSKSEPEEQVKLIRLLAEKRSEIIHRAITEALGSPHAVVRREAAWALSVTPYPPSAVALRELLSDDDEEVRKYAMSALKRLGESHGALD